MTSEQVKNSITDKVERAFDQVHGVVDVVTAPLAPVDGVIHGAARGIINWVTDKHPHGKDKSCGPPAPAPCSNYSPPSQTPTAPAANNSAFFGGTGNQFTNNDQKVNNQGSINIGGK